MNESINEAFEIKYENDYGRVYVNEKLGIIVCEAKLQYVPMEAFKALFRSTTPLIRKYGIQKFIFDKRNLRVFHQPSMEWYFVKWKKEVLRMGLKKHRKILPEEKWFQKSVEAGKQEIFQKYDIGFLKEINIAYCKTMREAIDS